MKKTNIANISAELETCKNRYVQWMFGVVDCPEYGAPASNYTKLLYMLLSIPYVPTLVMDENRLIDGQNLIREFYYSATGSTTGPWWPEYCSILEMMIALAIRAEDIMEDPDIGNRTSIWFWRMIDSLGLIQQNNLSFNPEIVSNVIERFLRQEYLPNGSGGLFTLPGCPVDLRVVEIWEQMIWYLDRVIDNEQH